MSTETETRPAARDAQHVPLSKADRLRQDAEAAAQLRRLANDPDVVALRVEQVRQQVDAAIWVGIFLGLAFTMVNVQSFAAAGAAPWSLVWLSAWLLDPMVSLVLVAVLRAEQITARYQVHTGKWAHRTKWFAFLATYVMNTWQSWTHLDIAGIVLHSVPPVLVFLAAETAPVLRDRLTAAVLAAAGDEFTGRAPAPTAEDSADPAVNTEHTAAAEDREQPTQPVHEPAPAARRAPRRKPVARKSGGRRLLADYVADARRAWTPGTEITPAWVRSVLPDVSRGTSKNVADALTAELATAAPAAGTGATASEREAA
ncbi:hypothetical protein BAY59_36520 [Prauserella coralliicola]|nr:hypothetical protein BAY59_36520 [Prauserella coralliicola]